MLYNQIPKNILNKISVDLNIDLKIINIHIKEKENLQTRSDKLNVVASYIEKDLDVGDVDHPKSYFKAAMPMRWGHMFGGAQNFVYFAGETEETIFGLGGSLQHVIG